ncbi:MAG: AmmeMemoRadiSam system protein B [Desulfobacteraceae bacterium]|nr:AmmeMemoRadiSam system protein B [Desulfobacteraceae bacterium]
MKTRKPVYAGSWYPSTARECESQINEFIKIGKTPEKQPSNWVGGIVPHAGWYYSGAIACNVIQALVTENPPDVIVIFGMHLHPGSAAYIMAEGAWETPFGLLPVETHLAEALVGRFSFHVETTSKYSQDNTIELQLPFIKYFFPQVKIVAMGVPPTKQSLEIGSQVVEITRELGLKAAVLGSTDLTHYGANYGFTAKGTGAAAVNWVRDENDRRVIEAMLSLDADTVIDEALANNNACCAGAAATAIAAGLAMGSSTAETIAYATSYDKSPGDSFVGYVGIVF